MYPFITVRWCEQECVSKMKLVSICTVLLFCDAGMPRELGYYAVSGGASPSGDDERGMLLVLSVNVGRRLRPVSSTVSRPLMFSEFGFAPEIGGEEAVLLLCECERMWRGGFCSAKCRPGDCGDMGDGVSDVLLKERTC